MSFLPSLLLFGVAVIIAFGTAIWLLVLAFQRRIWWGLAVLFVPLANLVFIVVEWQAAKRPFLLSLLTLPLCAGAWVAIPRDHPFMQAFMQQILAPAVAMRQETADDQFDPPAAEPAPTSPASSAPTAIADQLATLQRKEAALLARKKALDPADKAAALALSHEIIAYNAELQDALAARDRVAQSAPAR